MGGNDTITGNGNTRIAFLQCDRRGDGRPGRRATAAGHRHRRRLGRHRHLHRRELRPRLGLSPTRFIGSNNARHAENSTGGGGNDFIDGRGGFDRAIYNSDGNITSGISVDTGGRHRDRRRGVGTDTLRSIEAIRGTNFADTFTRPAYRHSPAPAPNAGNGGNFNEFEGMGGNDTITGNGNTRISFANATAGVTVDLSAARFGTATRRCLGRHRHLHRRCRARPRLELRRHDLWQCRQQHPRRPGRQRHADGRGGNDTLTGGAGAIPLSTPTAAEPTPSPTSTAARATRST